MIVEFDKSFYKSLDNITNSSLLRKIQSLIHDLEQASGLHEVRNIKKLIGYKTYYRVRMGDYRLGFELRDSSRVRFIIFGHRKDIYKKFP